MMPRITLLALFALAGIPLVIGIGLPGVGQIGVLLTLAVFGVALLDLALSASLMKVDIEREVSDVLSVGARHSIKLRCRNRNGSTVKLTLHDEAPMPAKLINLPMQIEVPSGRVRSQSYQLIPHNRGLVEFGDIHLRMNSRLGLWRLYDERPASKSVRIYPFIQAVHQLELLARQNRVADGGVKLSRLRGRGSDFDRLREFRREDEYRSIDWKATARYGSLISREYVVERNQNVIFLLDNGRSMCNQEDGISHFDRSLNAAILLSYVALKQGDSVGMLACSNTVNRWVPPLRGPGALQKVISQTYDLQATYEASDYGLMVEELTRRYRKRSLVVLVTHALDEVHLSNIAAQMRRLQSPHLVLLAFLKNVPLQARVETVPETDIEAFQVAAAAGMVDAQTKMLAGLEKSGLLVVDALPDQLSAGMISQYLDVKARHLL